MGAGVDEEGTLVLAYRAELIEVRKLISHYAREIISHELQLERLDREQQRAYRRAEELNEAIDTQVQHELREQAHGLNEPTSERVIRLLEEHPGEDFSAQRVAIALALGEGYTRQLLAEAVRAGSVRRVRMGAYRAKSG